MEELVSEAQKLKSAIDAAKNVSALMPGKKVQAAEHAVDMSYRLMLKMLGKMGEQEKRLQGVECGQNQ